MHISKIKSARTLEEFYPLARQVGIEMGARVIVDEQGTANQRIVFRRGKKEASVTCVHVVANQIDVGEDVFDTGSHAYSTEGHPIDLAPEEHFFALKSYVQSLAETGIEELYIQYANTLQIENASNKHRVKDLPFGFNITMQHLIVKALINVAPDVFPNIQYATWQNYLSQKIAWIAERFEILDRACGLSQAIKDEQFLDSLPTHLASHARNLRILCVVHYLTAAYKAIPESVPEARNTLLAIIEIAKSLKASNQYPTYHPGKVARECEKQAYFCCTKARMAVNQALRGEPSDFLVVNNWQPVNLARESLVHAKVSSKKLAEEQRFLNFAMSA